MMRAMGLLGVGLMALFAVIAPNEARADFITYELDCVFVGGACTADSPSYGTVTLTEVTGGDIQIHVDLTGTDNKILEVFLNYDFEFADDTLSISGDATNLQVALDGINVDGCTSCFDIAIPGQGGGNLGQTDTFTAVIASSAGDLDLANFNLPDGDAFAAVHIGNLGPGNCSGTGCTAGQTGEGSVFAGGHPTPIPEPSTLFLVGSGLVGVGTWGRKRLSRMIRG